MDVAVSTAPFVMSKCRLRFHAHCRGASCQRDLMHDLCIVVLSYTLCVEGKCCMLVGILALIFSFPNSSREVQHAFFSLSLALASEINEWNRHSLCSLDVPISDLDAETLHWMKRQK